MMAENIIIRRARLYDLHRLTEMLKQLFAIEKDLKTGVEKYEAGLTELICGDTGAVFVAEIDGKTAGMATAQAVISTSAGGLSLLVEDVFVLEGYRKKGVGKGLLEVIKMWGAKKGALRMQLVADRKNRGAVEFYKKLGWNETEMKGMYYYL
jgi:GNAT superfamily N-acetyltransferase